MPLHGLEQCGLWTNRNSGCLLVVLSNIAMKELFSSGDCSKQPKVKTAALNFSLLSQFLSCAFQGNYILFSITPDLGMQYWDLFNCPEPWRSSANHHVGMFRFRFEICSKYRRTTWQPRWWKFFRAQSLDDFTRNTPWDCVRTFTHDLTSLGWLSKSHQKLNECLSFLWAYCLAGFKFIC